MSVGHEREELRMIFRYWSENVFVLLSGESDGSFTSSQYDLRSCMAIDWLAQGTGCEAHPRPCPCPRPRLALHSTSQLRSTVHVLERQLLSCPGIGVIILLYYNAHSIIHMNTYTCTYRYSQQRTRSEVPYAPRSKPGRWAT